MFVASVYASPYEHYFVVSMGPVFLVSLRCLASSPSSVKFSELCLMFGCRVLHLLPFSAGENLSDDDYVKLCL